MSRRATDIRIGRIHDFIALLGNDMADYALCRFRRWREAGYRCLSFEGWVFAYEIFDDGILVRDMAHAAVLHDTD
jgi:hypothetical protein